MTKLRIDVITLFPEMVVSIQQHGVVGRALQAGLAELHTHNPRQHSANEDGRLDARPYGGGPGMVMQYAPLRASIEHCVGRSQHAKVVYLSPQGKQLDQAAIAALAASEHLVMLCGRYEGIDERVIDSCVDEEYSLGDYVISGGELAAMVLIDAIIRTLPDALGHELSAQQDSFAGGLLDCPHYTRPEQIDGQQVPAVLLSGDHHKIAEWRLQQALARTYLRRPDLMADYPMSEREKRLLEAFLAANSSTE